MRTISIKQCDYKNQIQLANYLFFNIIFGVLIFHRHTMKIILLGEMHMYVLDSRVEKENLSHPSLFENLFHFDTAFHFQQKNMTCCLLINQNLDSQSQEERKTKEAFKIIFSISIKTKFFRRLLLRSRSYCSQGASPTIHSMFWVPSVHEGTPGTWWPLHSLFYEWTITMSSQV